MRVARQKNPAPQILQCGIFRDAFHQPLAQSSAAMRFQHEYVTQISYGGKVAYHPCKTDLPPAVFVDTETQRVLNRARNNLWWNAFGPIAVSQKPVNHI